MGREKSDNGFYQCDYCGKDFEQEKKLRKHMKNCEERPENC